MGNTEQDTMQVEALSPADWPYVSFREGYIPLYCGGHIKSHTGSLCDSDWFDTYTE